MHPYKTQPDHAFWARAVGRVAATDVDPIVQPAFQIDKQTRIAAAGSCFAQHLARYLQLSGFNYMVTETPHPLISEEISRKFNYGNFTARFGNVYTTKQLLQLFLRAFDKFSPVEDVWQEQNGRFYDPFRPQIQPNGYATLAEYRRDRERHFAAVREMFRTVEVFIFTLGLTEAWMSARDGAVYPLCPGVAAGAFSPTLHQFKNFRLAEVVQDFGTFYSRLKKLNPGAKMLLTVSPVPLVATAENRHVLQSTVYSKSVLRVACQELQESYEDIHYFPSYEIICGHHTKGMFFEDDKRSVAERGVDHVMGLFFKHYANIHVDFSKAAPSSPAVAACDCSESERLAQALCDEELLDS